jgi:hypothetical protein
MERLRVEDDNAHGCWNIENNWWKKLKYCCGITRHQIIEAVVLIQNAYIRLYAAVMAAF